jgi:hypothetical protein
MGSFKKTYDLPKDLTLVSAMERLTANDFIIWGQITHQGLLQLGSCGIYWGKILTLVKLQID